jgi:hypothetical protein
VIASRFRFAFPLSCGLLAAVSFPLAAQSGYLPPNPITPPTVSPPKYAGSGSVAPVELPVVSAPEVSGISASPGDGKNGTTGEGKRGAREKPGDAAGPAKAGQAGTGAGNGSALPDDLSSVSALTLLGLAKDNPLLGALTGSSADSRGVDELSALLSGGDGEALPGLGGSGNAVLQKAIARIKRERDATVRATGGTADGVNAGAAVGPSKGATKSVSVAERVVSGGEIARFTVNGYDVAKSVTALVSSAIARDGSFLITADRTYAAGDRWLVETFYLLCKKTGPGTYELYADVEQNPANANSFLYRLARKTPVEGRSAGDLVTFGTADGDFRLDLAIRLFSASVGQGSGR